MATKLEINAKFLDCIIKLQRMIKGTRIAEIRVMATETSFINNQGKPVNLSLLEGSITNPSNRAMESYLSDLQRIDISTRLPDLAPEGTLTEKLTLYVKKFFLANAIK
ncbi:18663_t:CDS:1 [Gigaspora rosea]|nr:18663_t:CDS:1 [Gigaspora rosea]